METIVKPDSCVSALNSAAVTNLSSEHFSAPLEGGFVDGTLIHRGSFSKLATLVPGYFGIERGYKPLARLLVELDDELAVATFEPLRCQPQRGLWTSEFVSPLLVPHRLLGQSARAVTEHVAKTHSGIEEVSLIGHSTGGPGALNAANHSSLIVHNVILLASAGVTGHNALSLALKAPIVLWEGLSNHDRLVANLGEEPAYFFLNSVHDLVHYAFTNPLRTSGEALAVGQCNAMKNVKRARALGIKVGGLFINNDAFFPGDVAKRMVSSDLDSFICLGSDMGHLAPQTHTSEIAATLHVQLAELGKLATAKAIA
ncbi:MAG TPA: hypothetical protein VFN56_00805 [Candidatus Saccharimonadales bacterium]|nr:hypothetical protein [Candidatus Saccharimonadales bacterium]